MLRTLLNLTAGVGLTMLAALPAFAIDATEFDISGVDRTQGPYVGTLDVDPRPDGKLEVERNVRYLLTGRAERQTGVLRARGNDRWSGVVRSQRGAAGALAGRPTSAVVVALKVDESAGTVTGLELSGRGLSRFSGQAQAPVVAPAPTPAPAPAPPLQQPSGETFAGHPIYDYDPAIGITDVKGAYRVSVDWQNEDGFEDLLKQLLNDPKIDQIEALVLGYWGYDPVDSVQLLLNDKAKLLGLKALFVGDIDQEEAEISWISNSDLGPLIRELPELETLKVRGGMDLGFSGAFTHTALKEIVIESGGTPGSAVRELGELKLPNLERLELWLGTDEYGGDATIQDLSTILAGTNLPKVKWLGLMNSDITNAIAGVVAAGGIVERLDVLDLSMGTIDDRAAPALLASPKVRRLKSLNLDHNYLSDAVRTQLEALKPVKVSAADSAFDPDYPDDRYTAVGE